MATRVRVDQGSSGQRHLQGIEEDEGIGGAAAEIQQRGQRGHVQQQAAQQLAIADAAQGAPAVQTDQVQRHQAGQHAGHGLERQVDVEHRLHEDDGADLADDGEPAQLDQLQHVLQPGGVARSGGPRTGLRRGVTRRLLKKSG